MTIKNLIAICKDDPSLNCYRDISGLPAHILDEIKHFFKVYKQLEGKETIVTNLLGREAAIEIIEKCIKNYEDKFEKKEN